MDLGGHNPAMTSNRGKCASSWEESSLAWEAHLLAVCWPRRWPSPWAQMSPMALASGLTPSSGDSSGSFLTCQLPLVGKMLPDAFSGTDPGQDCL